MDKQIYELMAQAEILQEHALEIQNGAVKAISGIPEAVDEAKEKIRSMVIWGSVVWLFFGIAIFFALWFTFKWSTETLREEKSSLKWEIDDLKGQIEKLRKEVQSEKGKLAEVQTWGIELVKSEGQRWIKLGKGDKVAETRTGQAGTVWINITRGK